MTKIILNTRHIKSGLLLMLFSFLFAWQTLGQVYYPVTNLAGTATYGCTNVTVTSIDYVNTATHCTSGPYWIGGYSGTGSTTPPNPGSYTWTFDPTHPAMAIKARISVIGPGDDITISVNTAAITPAMVTLTPYSDGCYGTAPEAILDGSTHIVTLGGANDSHADVLINPGYGITSVTIYCAGGALGNGIVTDFQFTPMVPVPIAYAVTGGGVYCAGTAGAHIGLLSSDAGVSYQVFLVGGGAVGSPVIGTGAAIDLGLFPAGVYKVIGTGVPGCTTTMTGTATINMSPAPTIYSVTGGGTYCAGGTGVHIGLSNSDAGIKYSLIFGGVAITSITSTGGPLDFGLEITAGTYSVIAENTTTGCTSNMTGSALVSITPIPIAYATTGGGSYCAGTSGSFDIGLSGSDPAVTYQLYIGGSPVIPSVILPGTGSALDFGFQSVPGIYTIVANPGTSCSTVMTGSATIIVNPSPTVHNVTGGGSYCVGGTGVDVGLDNSDAGIKYQLYNGTSAIGGLVAGTGSPIDFGYQTAAGTYTVQAINPVTGCTSGMAGSAVITILSIPSPYTIIGGGSYCSGTGGSFDIMLSGSDIGVTYQLYIGSSPVIPTVILAGTGSALDFGYQSAGGIYTIVANPASTCAATMTGTATITVIPLPTPIVGPASICVGQTVTYTSTPAGGTWSNSLIVDGVIDPATGKYTGVGTGTDIISYSSGPGCFVIMPVIVNYTPEPITGTTTVCQGQTTTLACATPPGGTWWCPSVVVNIPNPYSGVIIGSFAPFTATVYYIAPSTGCSSSVIVTVIAPPPALAISGPFYVCTGHTITLTTGIPGGTWSSSSTSLATVDPSLGIVTGVAGGTPTITYTHPTEACYSTFAPDVIQGPTAYHVTGGGSYCAGDVGVHVGLSFGTTGVTYTLYNGSTYVTTVLGTNHPIDFGLQTAVGTYTVSAMGPSGYYCTAPMAGSAVVSISGSLPTMFPTYILGTGRFCQGGAGVPIYTFGSSADVNYQLYRYSTPVTGALLTGTGSALTFPPQASPGTYSVLATVTGSGCHAFMPGSPILIEDYIYTVIGGGPYCVGGPGSDVKQSSGDVGVQYQLYNGTTAMGAPVPGPGCCTAIDYGFQTAPGTYTVLATDPAAGCSFAMVGHATIYINSLPAIHTVTGSDGCAVAGVTVGLSSSTNSIVYTLILGGTTTVATYTSTGGAFTFPPQYVAGVYTVLGYDTYTGCTSTMTGSVTAIAPGGGMGCKPGHTGEDNPPPATVTEFNVYPNPTNGTLNVQTPLGGTFCLYTLEGKELQHYIIAEGTTALNLPNGLATGIYLCKFTDSKGNMNMVRLVYQPN